MANKKGIEVVYDGGYPNTCSGTMTIKLYGNVIYSRKYCCFSTGGLDKNYEPVEGELVWKEYERESLPSLDNYEDIEEAVKEELSRHTVCCGGCV